MSVNVYLAHARLGAPRHRFRYRSGTNSRPHRLVSEVISVCDGMVINTVNQRQVSSSATLGGEKAHTFVGEMVWAS